MGVDGSLFSTHTATASAETAALDLPPRTMNQSRIFHPEAGVVPPAVDWSASMVSPRPIDRESDWQRSYRRRLVVTDFIVSMVAGLVAYAVRFGDYHWHPDTLVYLAIALVAPFAWIGALLVTRTYEHRFLGVGSEEYRRVAVASLIVFTAIATTSYAFFLELSRGFVLVAFPLATLATLVGRYANRKWLHRVRGDGKCMSRVIVVGHRSGVEALVRQVRTTPYHGLDVIGACTPTGEDPDGDLAAHDIPVLGSFDSVVDAVKQTGADSVAVMPSPEMDGPTMRRLGWHLEATNAEMLVAPAVVEVVGPRIHIRPVCGLPLLHVDRPELDGVHRWLKGAFDRVAAAAALLVLLPVLLTVAAVIRATSRGPALFKQIRVGRHGEEFTMLKFRSMVQHADGMVTQLGGSNEGAGVLFKLRRDPRVTRVGSFLRKYSLDELPQLVNVVQGHMSLVGPRPPLPHEVARYRSDMRRRLLVKPGLTGLWQISGRSDLSWEESVRLDLRYVENWSFAFDLMIIWKTVGAVLTKRGAY